VEKIDESKLKKAFGQNLRKLRLEKGYTQEELAGRCGVPLSQIGRLERGEKGPMLISLARLSVGLEVPQSVLFDYDIQGIVSK
jgi:transcriptional regulator with XRE-family HTH domain